MKFTAEEKKLLDRLIMAAIQNGNTVNPKAFEPSPTEYKALCMIRNKLTEERSGENEFSGFNLQRKEHDRKRMVLHRVSE